MLSNRAKKGSRYSVRFIIFGMYLLLVAMLVFGESHHFFSIFQNPEGHTVTEDTMAIELSQVQPRNSVDDFVVLTREDLSDQVLEFCGGDVFCLDSKALKKKRCGLYLYMCIIYHRCKITIINTEKLVEVESECEKNHAMLGQFVATSSCGLPCQVV